MGDGVVITCPKCNYEVDALLGNGGQYYDLLNVIKYVPYRRRKHVADILNNHSVQAQTCWHSLFECPKCKRFAARFSYKIEYDNGQVEETSYRCPKCRIPLVEHDGNLEILRKTICPICHDALLSIQEHCPWD